MENPSVGIIIRSIRAGRFGDKPARWISDIARGRSDLDFEIVDLRDHTLPFLGDERWTTDAGEAARERWCGMMAAFDGYIFVTAEYNHSITGVLKNALDHAYPEFNRKPAAFVGYGGRRRRPRRRATAPDLHRAPARSHQNGRAHRHGALPRIQARGQGSFRLRLSQRSSRIDARRAGLVDPHPEGRTGRGA